MTKSRRKQAEENRRRMEAHNREHQWALAVAAQQRREALGKELAGGLRPVPLPLLEHDLDRADPRVPSGVRDAHNGVYVAPQFQPSLVREKEPVTQPYISPNRITLRRVETISPKTGKKSGGFGLRGLKLPPDVVRRLIDRVDGLVLEVELNDDGILFRPAGAQPTNVSLPAWVPIKK